MKSTYKLGRENMLTYSREPTKAEVMFGYGARHYKDFPRELAVKKDGKIKKRLKCPADGLWYSRG